MTEQIVLKEKTTLELKALAWDFQVVVNNYSSFLREVVQELTNRAQQEVASNVQTAAPLG